MNLRIGIVAVTICVATFPGFDSYHPARAFTDPDQDWQNWSDQAFAPPGWDCVYQHELDAGDCEPRPGWEQVFDPVSKADILVRSGKWERQIDVDTARAWEDLSPKEQYTIRTARAVVYDFLSFERTKKGCTVRFAMAEASSFDPPLAKLGRNVSERSLRSRIVFADGRKAATSAVPKPELKGRNLASRYSLGAVRLKRK